MFPPRKVILIDLEPRRHRIRKVLHVGEKEYGCHWHGLDEEYWEELLEVDVDAIALLELLFGGVGEFAEGVVAQEVVFHLAETSGDSVLEHVGPHLGLLGLGLAVFVFDGLEFFVADVPETVSVYHF